MEYDTSNRLIFQCLAVRKQFTQVPGNRLAFAVRVGGQIEDVGFFHRLDDGIHVFGIAFDQLVFHGEVVIGVDCAFFGYKVADMAIRRHDLIPFS